MTSRASDPDVVLTTINAPHRRKLTAAELARCLQDHEAARAAPGHMSSFFGEIRPELQLAFADAFGIGRAQLVASAKAFSAYSGQAYPLAA
jgi:hypothetical protein